jgi:DnaJ-class molecular chaperone
MQKQPDGTWIGLSINEMMANKKKPNCCRMCQGSGQNEWDGTSCSVCSGRGVIVKGGDANAG